MHKVPASKTPQKPPKSAIQGALGTILRDAREDAGLAIMHVRDAYEPRDGKPRPYRSTFSRLENGQTWPHDIDRALDAYIALTDLTSRLAIWQQAVATLAAATPGTSAEHESQALDPADVVVGIGEEAGPPRDEPPPEADRTGRVPRGKGRARLVPAPRPPR